MSPIKYGEKVAQLVHEPLNCFGATVNADFPKEIQKENYCPRTIIDETLEEIDPIPCIHTLFIQLNEKFFWNSLLSVKVEWSPSMTRCSGLCKFFWRTRKCQILLSIPLLKLRPRKHLVQTLLHEMIHAYLFLTDSDDNHGPIFQSHMKRINNEAGTNITICHNFFNEIEYLKKKKSSKSAKNKARLRSAAKKSFVSSTVSCSSSCGATVEEKKINERLDDCLQSASSSVDCLIRDEALNSGMMSFKDHVEVIILNQIYLASTFDDKICDATEERKTKQKT